jgi:tetratricopeptide (TPR) repeat protein
MDSGAEALGKEDYKEAIKQLSKALVLAETNGSPDDRFDALTALGCVHGMAKEYNKAEQYYSRALSLSFLVAQIGEYLFGSCMASLANVYWELGRDEECRATALKALPLLEKDHGQDRMPVILPLLTLAKISLRECDYERAAVFTDQAVAVLMRYPSENKEAFIANVSEVVERIPDAILLRYASKWSHLREGALCATK